MRIRGQIGPWPVDLTIELDPAEWAQVNGSGETVPVSPVSSATPPPVQRPDDAQWQAACAVLAQAGHMPGPALLESLEGLAGSTAAGKRLLVRLRHNPSVRVESGVDAPIYHWVE
ncbi:hypothetical protein G7Z99_12430 [Pseudomonas entomophila]|uniref:hypothetical protein n=1 Tax=Pseudomonas entomophila TaxID=312306 RepID=UPI0015E334A6|nr:hypothetical protein [Pseudomonas entomophila]MBA1189853.1 hypothetical protein [Pseudomonas entomophila]